MKGKVQNSCLGIALLELLKYNYVDSNWHVFPEIDH